MHELGIVFHIIKQVEEVGEENGVSLVSSVTLEIGQVSGVLHDYLEDCWNWAKLIIDEIPAVTYCEDCGEKYSTVEYGKTCPKCSGDNTYLLNGNEIMIKEIEVQ